MKSRLNLVILDSRRVLHPDLKVLDAKHVSNHDTWRQFEQGGAIFSCVIYWPESLSTHRCDGLPGWHGSAAKRTQVSATYSSSAVPLTGGVSAGATRGGRLPVRRPACATTAAAAPDQPSPGFSVAMVGSMQTPLGSCRYELVAPCLLHHSSYFNAGFFTTGNI